MGQQVFGEQVRRQWLLFDVIDRSRLSNPRLQKTSPVLVLLRQAETSEKAEGRIHDLVL
jgi:hypothetical protein